MPPQDLNKLISYLKWSAFVFCKIAFIWKVSDGMKSYISKDIGTKTTMLENYEADLPGKLKIFIEQSFTKFFSGFAVCRHSNQITSLFANNKSFHETYNMTLSDLRYIKAYEMSGDGLEPILKQFLVNTSDYIRSATLASHGKLARVTDLDLVSKPNKHPEEWPSFFHPLYGVCFSFEPSQTKIDQMGKTVINYLKISVDFRKAFPYFQERNATGKLTMKEYANMKGENNLLLVSYDKGSFLTSQHIETVKKGFNYELTLNQEIVDKSKTKHVYNCDNYEMESEDDCLGNCLAATFYQEFGCLHLRLKLMNMKNHTLKHQRPCLLKDLQNKTKHYLSEINRDGGKRSAEEFGLVRIKQLLSSFHHEHELVTRCGCPPRCKRRVISINKFLKETDFHKTYTLFKVRKKLHTYQIMFCWFINLLFLVSQIC